MQSAHAGNFPKESENLINKLINLCWSIEQTYLTMSAACAGDEISMLGFSEYFRLCCNRMRAVADKLCQFLTIRGGRLTMGEVHSLIQIASCGDCTVEKFMHMALDMEKQFEEKLSELCGVAKNVNDLLTAEYIESSLLLHQIHALRITLNHVNGLKACENPWMYDTMTMKPLVREIYELIGCGRMGNTCSGVIDTTSTTGVSRSTNGCGRMPASESLQSFACCLRQ